MSIVDIMIEQKIAQNAFHAANMLNVLQCGSLPSDAARLDRCRLYKAWKLAGENKTEARRKAIAGESAPAVMFAEAE